MSDHGLEVYLGDPIGELPELLATVPDWALRVISVNSGCRGDKYPLSYYANERHFGGYSPMGAWADGRDDDGFWNARDRAKTRRERREAKRAAKATVSAADSVAPGNLPEDDYRFWEGIEYGGATQRATCKWCQVTRLNKAERQLHFKKESNCSHLLRAVYEYARSTKPMYCVVCAKPTAYQRWGLPICNSEKCIRDWKFSGSMHWASKGLREYANVARKRGLLLQWEPTVPAKVPDTNARII